MKVKSILDGPALGDNWSLNPIFSLFESGCITQVLLFMLSDQSLPSLHTQSMDVEEGSDQNIRTQTSPHTRIDV